MTRLLLLLAHKTLFQAGSATTAAFGSRNQLFGRSAHARVDNRLWFLMAKENVIAAMITYLSGTCLSCTSELSCMRMPHACINQCRENAVRRTPRHVHTQ
jgi:hypothetical protein